MSATLAAEAAFDTRAFRDALGSFATGVTVITTRAADGSPVGLTANSFNSVSLEPPMVLWSLARASRSLPAFEQASHWAVHVLGADQEAVSNRFARRGEDKFAGLPVERGEGDVPLLRGCAARFECRGAFRYDGGDHVIFVGEVVRFARGAAVPLVFHAGQYALAATKDKTLAEPRSARLAGSFDEDFLGYLLGRAYHQLYHGISAHAAKQGLSDHEYFVLSTLTVRERASADEIDAVLDPVGMVPAAALLARLQERGLVQRDRGNAREFVLTPRGRDITLHVIAAAKGIEADLLGRIGYGNGLALKQLLQQVVNALGNGRPDLWAGQDEA
jgi:3-hydroxy-9,10-secoandrosta-1,3,5(10)-triene-9,17-dione monooxygenase reductase component